MNKVTKITRKWILLDLLGYKNIDVEKIILTFFKAEKLPSNDLRYKNMEWDFYQHRRNNFDWGDDWFLDDNRLEFYEILDRKFLDFVCFAINPENLDSLEVRISLVKIFNDKLIRDWFEIKPSWAKISWLDIFEWYEIFWGELKLDFYTDYPVFYSIINDRVWRKHFPSFDWEKQYPCIVLTYNNWDDFLHFISTKLWVVLCRSIAQIS